jgi:hypothetical protein
MLVSRHLTKSCGVLNGNGNIKGGWGWCYASEDGMAAVGTLLCMMHRPLALDSSFLCLVRILPYAGAL